MDLASVNSDRRRYVGSLYGLAAAVLFGVSTPLSKLLLPSVTPLMLAALLYLGAGIGVSLFRVTELSPARKSSEARLRRSDFALLGAIIMFGGVIGPVLMLAGLSRISALAGSLLLNLEAVFTILIAVVIFGEHLSSASALASGLVVFGALMMSYDSGPVGGDLPGVLAVAGACLSWAVENNLSQRLSLRNPYAVVQVKALGAAACTIALALATGNWAGSPAPMLGALLLGSLSYGVSLVCVMQALRYLGAAREAAWFSTAPFVGAVLSIAIFGTLPRSSDIVAASLMIAGVMLLLRERHSHLHAHETLEHDHAHLHDEHHQHAHDSPVPEVHSHPHRHDPITHDHPHVSEVHHRHPHTDGS